MVTANDGADDGGRLSRFLLRAQVQILVHGEQETALHRFQAVADVGKGTRHDYRHGIGQVTPLGFLGQGGRVNGLRN